MVLVPVVAVVVVVVVVDWKFLGLWWLDFYFGSCWCCCLEKNLNVSIWRKMNILSRLLFEINWRFWKYFIKRRWLRIIFFTIIVIWNMFTHLQKNIFFAFYYKQNIQWKAHHNVNHFLYQTKGKSLCCFLSSGEGI